MSIADTDIPVAQEAGRATQGATGIYNIDAMLSGAKWNALSLTFMFPDTAAYFGAGYGNQDALQGFALATAAQQTAAKAAFAALSGLTDLSFTETSASLITGGWTPHVDITIARSSDPGTAYAYYPHSSQVGGDVWLGVNGGNSNPVKGNYAWHTMWHELGHALGLKHGHETDGVASHALTTDRDSMEFSIMTYRGYIGAQPTGYVNETWGYAQSFMMYDIAALQAMYGADFTTNAGNSVYTFSSSTGEMFINGAGQGAPGGNRIFLTLWDGGGVDTYDFSNYTTNLSIDLTPGGWSTLSQAQIAYLGDANYARANVFNALQYNGDARSLIENAVGGSGNDTITGNDANNVLTGGAGGDALSGGGGSDTASYEYATTRVIANLADPSINQGEAAGDSYNSIENLTGTNLAASGDALVGNDGRNVLMGLAGADQLFARAGDDVLYGGAGDDLMFGGLGSDWLDGGDGTDTVSYQEAGSAIIVDMLNASIAFGEAAGDQLISIENIIGSSWNDTLAGDNGRNFLYGQDGNDALFGRAGADVLYGGNGDDTLVGGQGSDWLDGGAGLDYASYLDAGGAVTVDMVVPAINRGDAAGDQLVNIEGVVGSNFNDVLLGDNFNNVFLGADGNDVIYGRGGNDYLIGGAGADQFRFANVGEAGDTIADFQVGIDTLQFSASGFGGGLIGGALAADRLVIGTSANQAFGQFIFDSSTSILYWDADGTGSATKVAMLAVSNISMLSTSDFLINA